MNAPINLEPIILEPVFQHKIWGGRALADSFGYDIPQGAIGECWAISAHPHGDCTIAKGQYKGKKLSELYMQSPQLFAASHIIQDPTFPLLVKIIDAQESLSVQVHPDDTYAYQHENGSLGKRECWYILDAAKDTTIVVGQKARSRDEFVQKMEQGKWSELLNTIPCKPGDFFMVEPGTVHAIQQHTLILETQQSSDITYRVYDYDRRQPDGSLRELHVDRSLDVINYDDECVSSGAIQTPTIRGVTELVACENFTVCKLDVCEHMVFEQKDVFQCLSVIKGSGTIAIGSGETHHITKGNHLIVPAGTHEVHLTGTFSAIASYPHMQTKTGDKA